jgi:hypothetical protein
MPVSKFTVGGVLQLLFLYINESPATLAEFYIDRDRTLVYKWLRDAAILPKKHVPDIIRFVRENSTQTVRLRIRNETDQFISESGLNATTKKTLLSNNDFDKYLEEVLYIAILEMKTKRLPQSASSQEGQEIAGASSSQAEGWSPEILPEATKPHFSTLALRVLKIC